MLITSRNRFITSRNRCHFRLWSWDNWSVWWLGLPNPMTKHILWWTSCSTPRQTAWQTPWWTPWPIDPIAIQLWRQGSFALLRCFPYQWFVLSGSSVWCFPQSKFRHRWHCHKYLLPSVSGNVIKLPNFSICQRYILTAHYFMSSPVEEDIFGKARGHWDSSGTQLLLLWLKHLTYVT